MFLQHAAGNFIIFIPLFKRLGLINGRSLIVSYNWTVFLSDILIFV